MRGKGKYKSLGTMGYGITPAYAGKRIKYRSLSYCTRDHPRLCGEKRIVQRYFVHSAGSPPPMRGKGLNRATRPTTCTDHPRLCGEKHGYYTIEVNYLGSPPPMRGKDNQIIKQQQELGITPAYAGKSCKVSCSHRLL